MGTPIFTRGPFAKRPSGEMSRREHIQDILENLAPANNDFEWKCWVQFLPRSYQRTYTLEETVEKINSSPWEGERVFSSEALNPVHKNSKAAYFPTTHLEVMKIIKVGKDAFHIGHFVFNTGRPRL